MDTRYLESFVAIACSGSIAEAARQLDTSVSSLTQRLKALEASVGVKLLVRSGRRVKPTPAGLRVLDCAPELMAAVQNLKSVAFDGVLPKGPLRLGTIPSMLTGFLPSVLKAWAHAYPEIEIYMLPGRSSVIYQQLLEQELDLAILVPPRFAMPKSFQSCLVRQEPLMLMTPPGMQVDDPLACLATHPYLRYDRGVAAGRMADEYLRERGIKPNVRCELDGIELIAALVAQDLGVSILPDWHQQPSKMLAVVQRIALPTPFPTRSVAAMWPRAAARTRLAELFVELCLAHGPGAPDAPETLV